MKISALKGFAPILIILIILVVSVPVVYFGSQKILKTSDKDTEKLTSDNSPSTKNYKFKNLNFEYPSAWFLEEFETKKFKLGIILAPQKIPAQEKQAPAIYINSSIWKIKSIDAILDFELINKDLVRKEVNDEVETYVFEESLLISDPNAPYDYKTVILKANDTLVLVSANYPKSCDPQKCNISKEEFLKKFDDLTKSFNIAKIDWSDSYPKQTYHYTTNDKSIKYEIDMPIGFNIDEKEKVTFDKRFKHLAESDKTNLVEEETKSDAMIIIQTGEIDNETSPQPLSAESLKKRERLDTRIKEVNVPDGCQGEMHYQIAYGPAYLTTCTYDSFIVSISLVAGDAELTERYFYVYDKAIESLKATEI